MNRYGLPHSEIPGSKPVSGSPRLIAASHALHRLLMPRHPPYALISQTINLLLTHSVFVACCYKCPIFSCQRTIAIYKIDAKNSPKNPLKSGPLQNSVELTRIERATPCVQGRCSPN